MFSNVCVAVCLAYLLQTPIGYGQTRDAASPTEELGKATVPDLQTIVQSGCTATAPLLMEFDSSGDYLVIAGSLTTEVCLWHLPTRTLVRRTYSKRDRLRLRPSFESQPVKLSIAKAPLRIVLESAKLFEVWDIDNQKYSSTALEAPKLDPASKPDWKHADTEKNKATSIAISELGSLQATGKVIDGKFYAQIEDLLLEKSSRTQLPVPPKRIAYSYEGNVLAAASSFGIQIFRKQPHLARILDVDSATVVTSLGFSQGSRNLIVSARKNGDQVTFVHDISSGESVAAGKHASPNLRPRFNSLKNLWITSGRKQFHKFLEVRTNDADKSLVRQVRVGGVVRTIAVHEQTGVVAAFVNDATVLGSVELYDFDSLEKIGELKGQTQSAGRPYFDSQTGAIYQTAQGIYQWDLENGKREFLHSAIGGSPVAVHDGKFLFRNQNQAILFDIADATQKEFDVSSQSEMLPAVFAASFDLKWYASASGTGVQMTNLSGEQANFRLERSSTVDRPVAEIAKVAFSTDGHQLAVVDLAGNLELWDLKSRNRTFEVQNKLFKSILYEQATSVKAMHLDELGFLAEGEFGSFSINNAPQESHHLETPIFVPSAISVDGLILARINLDASTIDLIDRRSFKIKAVIPYEVGEIDKLSFTDRVNELLVGRQDGVLDLLNCETHKPTARLIPTPEDGFTILCPDGYYKTNNGSVQSVAFRRDRAMELFDQFEGERNRPDIVLERLGRAKPQLIALHREAVNWRTSKPQASSLHESNALRLRFHNRLPISTVNESLEISVASYGKFSDGAQLVISVNGVPEIVEITKRVRKTLSFNVSLLPGDNRIVLYTKDGKGHRSKKLTHVVRCRASATLGRLFFVGVGVSKYQRPGCDLKLAAKDAVDIRDELKLLTHQPVESLLLLDESATENKVKKQVAEFLQRSSPCDTIILFLAGHGFLRDAEFRFALHESDFKSGIGAVSLLEIEKLINASSARRRILLLDACHSGAALPSARPEQPVAIETTGGAETNVKVSRRSSFDISSPDTSATDSRNAQLRNLLFSQFSNDVSATGTSILAASDGGQFALESSAWNNGAFTFAIREGLRHKTADLNNDKKITMRELASFVEARVTKLTEGEQSPQTRAMNTMLDPELISAIDYQQLELQFKRLKGQSDLPRVIASDRSGDWVAAAFNKSLHVLNLTTEVEDVIEFGEGSHSISRMTFTGNSKYLIVEEQIDLGYQIFAYELATQKRHQIFPEKGLWQRLAPLQFSMDENMAVLYGVPSYGVFSIWDFETGIERRTVNFGERRGTPTYVVLPSGKAIRTVAKGVVADVDLRDESRKELGTIEPWQKEEGSFLTNFRFSRTGKFIVREDQRPNKKAETSCWSVRALNQVATTSASSVVSTTTSDGCILSTKLRSFNMLSQLPRFAQLFMPDQKVKLSSPIRTIAKERALVSRDESLLALFDDGVRLPRGIPPHGIRVYSLSDGREVAWLKPPMWETFEPSFSANRKFVIAVDGNGNIYRWPLNPGRSKRKKIRADKHLFDVSR